MVTSRKHIMNGDAVSDANLTMFSMCFGVLFKKKRVFVTRIIPKIGFAHMLSKKLKVSVWNSDEAIPRETLKTNMQDGYDGLICMLTDEIDSVILDAAGNIWKLMKFSVICSRYRYFYL